jgi:DNA mismatch endonuclease (patch repair protein)
MVFLGKRVAIFIDGCFWHGCTRCHDFQKDCNDWWQDKIEANVARDRRQRSKLRKLGWRVWRVWEHDLRRNGDLEKIVIRLDRMLNENWNN